ncbi:MAG TPA: branched-chain amino acid ABC transporter permease [Anaerolineales bacterium]|nr:branched-chain amino acid ABC transporter permease [Anaerolineales bacterium]
MNRFGWLRRSPNVVAALAMAVVLLGLGMFEIVRPGGVDFSDLTGGLVTLDTMIRIGILTIVLVGMNLLMGYAGQVSLGQAAFYGLGAYASAILTARGTSLLRLPPVVAESWWWPWMAILIGMAFAGGLAYLIGRPILTLRGHYLAMATLGLGIVIYILFRENLGLPGSHITGSFDGITAVPRLRIGSFEVWPLSRYYFLVWACALLSMVLVLNIVNSRVGRALRAIHASEQAALAVGIDIAGQKLRALIVSAVLASLAGSLYGHFQAAVSPKPFDFGSSLELVVMSSVGGMASIWGAPFGVAVILILKEVLRSGLRQVLRGASGEHEIVVYGLLLIVIMIFMPEGVLVSFLRWLRRRWPASETIPAVEAA